MDYEMLDCIDAGTEYCPCHLAETGDCILCSQLKGKTFCDCINWKGVCIYQEYVWNGCKAKSGRREYLCKIINKTSVESNVMLFTILVSHKLAEELIHPGSFIFMRVPATEQFYDAPLSVMDVDLEENTIKIAFEVKGIKTKMINNIDDDNVLIRGPYWNGVLGLKNIYKCKDRVALLICRGIGQAPMVPVLKKLYSNGNKIIIIIDKSNFNEIFVSKYLDMCNCTIVECNTMKDGELTLDVKEIITNICKEYDVNLIHISGPDVLIYDVLKFMEIKGENNFNKIKCSCCNNAKMCCGDGICGACSSRFEGHVVKKLCKVQVDPKYIFEGRRLI